MDWVQARFEWDPSKAWEALKKQVEADVRKWEGLTGTLPNTKIKVNGDEEQLSVEKVLRYGSPGRWAQVYFDGDWIILRRFDFLQEEPQLKIAPILDDEAQPRFVVPLKDENGKQTLQTTDRELWQMSRQVLHGILFDEIS